MYYRVGANTAGQGVLIYCSYVKRGVGKRMSVSSLKKVTILILAVVPIIRALKFACRPSLLHMFFVLLFMHIPTKFAAYIFPWRPGGSEFSAFTFQQLGMRTTQEQMYDVLNLVVDACVEAGDIPIVVGDFNACIGLLESDDLTMLQHVGPVGIERLFLVSILKRVVCHPRGTSPADIKSLKIIFRPSIWHPDFLAKHIAQCQQVTLFLAWASLYGVTSGAGRSSAKPEVSICSTLHTFHSNPMPEKKKDMRTVKVKVKVVSCLNLSNAYITNISHD